MSHISILRLSTFLLLLTISVVFLAGITPSESAEASFIAPADSDSIRHIALPARDLIFDSNTQRIYASIPGSAGAPGNSITRIDPVIGVAEASIAVGSNPTKLAISDNKQFIYVGFDGESAFRRFVLATQTADLRTDLGNSPSNGPYFVEDMEVMPGAPQSVVISRRFKNLSPQHAGVVVFDNDVQRPTSTNVHVGHANAIEFSNSPATVYGFNNEDTGLQLFRLSVTPDGISINNQIPGLFNEFGDMEFDGGQLYHTAGRAVDPEAQTIVGTYTGMNFSPWINARSMVVDSANNRVYFLAGGAVDPGSNGTARLYAFNKATFALIDSFSVPGTVGRISSLVQWGPTGLAFRDDNRIFLVPTPGSAPAPSPTPTPFPPTPTPTPTPAPGELREIALATKDLVFSTNTQTLYASVPSTAGPIANTITLINPVSGTVGASIPIGSEPNKLTISDNGQQIHVALDGANAIRRFHVATQSAGLQFSAGMGSELSAMPGNPDSIAAISNGLVTIYDNGTPRPVTKIGQVTTIAFSNSPEVLYGYNESSSAFQFSNMVVGSCGVGLAKATERIITGSPNEIEYDNGRVYATNGQVIDPDTATLVGTFFVPSFAAALVEPDSKANRIYSLTTQGAASTLRVFDMQTFAQVGALSLPGVTGTPLSLIRWGANGLAFNTATQVFLLQNSLIGGPSPFTPAPTASPVPFTVSGTVLELNTPVSGVTISFSGVASGTTQTDANGKFAIGNLPLCGSLTITPSKPNFIFTPSSVTITNSFTQTANFSAFHRIIGFVQSQVTVNEGSSKVFLAIARSAGLPPTTTDIDYSTSNGTASDRSDYTAALGTFHFDVITAQAPLEVLLTDDVFVEGSETFTVTLEPVPGFDLVNPTVTVTIVDNDTSPPALNPVDSSAFFVRQHYHDFLNRDPDPGGLQFWTNDIESCGADKQCREVKRINVSAAFFLSIEFQETGYLAHRMYKVAYGDTTSPNVTIPVPIIRLQEFLRGAQRLGRGVQVRVGDWKDKLEANKVEYSREFVLTSRFVAEFPSTMTPAQFVQKLDQNAGGVLSTGERDQLITELTNASNVEHARASVVRKVAEDTDLHQREFNRAFVLMQFYGYLRRNPDDPQDTDFRGWEFWLNKLNQFNGSFEDSEMVKAFLTSTEYQQRFGP